LIALAMFSGYRKAGVWGGFWPRSRKRRGELGQEAVGIVIGLRDAVSSGDR